ncbi:MAG: anaerobic sulfatase maturase [Candidatus Aminicenantes bacterium]|nr:anaerobic sulfatase maturase [Candidatus Aminicenantes bacterium]
MAPLDFQVFVKPAGPLCNLACEYCYYLEKDQLYNDAGGSFRMPDVLLEEYIVQHIEASSEPVIRFSWHGGEPTVVGLDFFRKVVALQHKHQPKNQQISNGMQTNGTLLDEEWGLFLAEHDFFVGISLDGRQEIHDRFRKSKSGQSTFDQVLRGYQILKAHGVSTDILCVVNAHNVQFPKKVYRFFKNMGASYISFLPMVEKQADAKGRVHPLSVPAELWGEFLCTIFDEWLDKDIGRIKVQIFEEAARTAFGLEHSLCIFRRECGDIPVVEHNGDFYSCDHYVDEEHRLGNIAETPLEDLLQSSQQRAFGRAKRERLPQMCKDCEVRDMCNGGCPKNRFVQTPAGDDGLNHLCAGYKRFFTHSKPWVDQVALEWRRQK